MAQQQQNQRPQQPQQAQQQKGQQEQPQQKQQDTRDQKDPGKKDQSKSTDRKQMAEGVPPIEIGQNRQQQQ